MKGPWLGERPRSRGGLIQAVGFAICLALFAWAVSKVLGEEQRSAWESLRRSRWQDVALLVGLTAASLVVNASTFWITLRPLRRLPGWEMLAVHCVAAFLTILPFKLSLAVRAYLHRERHGLSWRHMASWGLAFAGLSAVTMLAVAAAVVWSKSAKTGLPGMAAAAAVCVSIAAGSVALLARATGRVPWIARFSVDAPLIAGTWWAAFGHAGLRLLDIGLFGARFWIAAKMAGVTLSDTDAATLGGVYFLLSAAAPTGSLGITEAGTAGLGGVVGQDTGTIAMLAMLTTACQTGLSGLLAVPAWLWVRPRATTGVAPGALAE